MKGYAVLAWDPANLVAAASLIGLRDRLGRHPTWTVVEAGPGVMVVLEGPDPPKVRRIAGARSWVLGDLYETATFASAPGELALPHDAADCARSLLQRFWGRYVAIWAGGDRLTILRDPSGAVEAVRWRAHGVEIVASGAPEDWLGALAPDLEMDWAVIAEGLAEPLGLSGRVALRGLQAIPPGGLWRPEGRTGAVAPLWTPARIARVAGPPGPDAAARLAAVVDGCVGAVARAGAPLVAELSGGLDSAILASALTRGAGAPVRAWVNVHAEDPESDERASARLVADCLGAPLTELAKPPFAFSEDGLTQAPAGLRPSLNGLDDAYDLALAELCRQAGARTLLTGQGGDAVFLQMVTPLALLDRRERQSGLRARTREALAIARGSRRSLWAVAAAALGASLRPTRGPRVAGSPFLAKAVPSSGAAPHPWLDDLQGLDPAKRLHVRALVYAQLAYGESRRGRVADLVHPLLSQPLVETCLALPVSVLTAGGRGRALARAAFRERLPPAVVDRRSKGDLTAHYGRAIARSLPVLRPFLLDGRLAAEGLLDRDRLEAALSPEHLIWRGGYADILQLVVMETWVRRWAERLETLGQARRRA